MIDRQYDQEPLKTSNNKHKQVVELVDKAFHRVKPSRLDILLCRNVRRNILQYQIPIDWFADEAERDSLTQWLVHVMPERKLLDLNLTNSMDNVDPKLTRTPLGSTDTAKADADNLEAWVNSDVKACVPRKSIRAYLIQDGELGTVVQPRTSGYATSPEYLELVEGKNGGKARRGRRIYDRDEQDRPPESKEYGGRNEGKSRRAWEEHRERHLAQPENSSSITRLIPALDCAPIMVRGTEQKPWVCKALVIRTLMEEEELIAEGHEWDGMGNRLLVPREYGVDNPYGQGGQIWLYEVWTMVRRDGVDHPTVTYCVGGRETWRQDGTAERAPTIDFYEKYGITYPLWDYHYGLHLEDDPAYRGMPFMLPLVPVLLNNEGLITAIQAAARDNAFAGHVTTPAENIPKESWLQTTFNAVKLKTFRKPRPGNIEVQVGPVEPFKKAEVGADAYKVLEINDRVLRLNSPDPTQAAAGAGGASGHAQVINHELLASARTQIRDGEGEALESIAARRLAVACALKEHDDLDSYTFLRDEEMLPSGQMQETVTAVVLNERWVSGNYHLTADFPNEGNLADISLAMDLADRGFGTDEDVDKARGVENTMLQRVKRANYQWIKSPEGAMDLQMAATKLRGDIEKMKRLMLVQAGRSTKNGVPAVALEDAAPAGAVPGTPPVPGAPTNVGNPVEQSTNAAIAGQMGIGPATQDAAAIQQIRSA